MSVVSHDYGMKTISTPVVNKSSVCFYEFIFKLYEKAVVVAFL